MDRNRENEICRVLWQFNGGFISYAQLDAIVLDKAEKHFAVCKLRGMGIRISNDYRTLAYGVEVNEAFRRRKDIERQLTIERRREQQHKEALRSI